MTDKLTVGRIEQPTRYIDSRTLTDVEYHSIMGNVEHLKTALNRKAELEELEVFVRSMFVDMSHDPVCATSYKDYGCGDKGWEDCTCDLIKIRDLLKELE